MGKKTNDIFIFIPSEFSPWNIPHDVVFVGKIHSLCNHAENQYPGSYGASPSAKQDTVVCPAKCSGSSSRYRAITHRTRFFDRNSIVKRSRPFVHAAIR